MGVSHSVRSKRPDGTRIDGLPADSNSLIPPEEDPPNLPQSRGERSLSAEHLQPGPWEVDVHTPASIDVGGIIERTVHGHPDLEARHVPIEEGPSAATWVRPSPECFSGAICISAVGERVPGSHIELRRVEPPALPIGILPDVEDFADRPQCIDDKLVVAIAAVDENLDGVLGEYEPIPCRNPRLDERLLRLEPDVKTVIGP